MNSKAQHFHENPAVLHVGTTPVRSYYIPCKSKKEALAGESSRMLSLNGDWSFTYYDSYSKAMGEDGEGFLCFDEEEMGLIPVPSCWQNHGCDRHMYTNINYPFPCDPPYVPEENPCGLYVRHFELTKKDLKNRLFLNFEGVDSAFYLWVNGEFAGYSQVSHATSEFELSDLAQEGDNTLCVLVLKWCDGSYLEDQDKLRMSGIFRDVYLLARPQSFLRDFFVKQEFSQDYQKAKIRIELMVEGKSCVTATLLAPDGSVLGESKPGTKALSFSVKNPILWNAEHPEQYTLLLKTDEECIAQKVGLRQVEIKDGIFRLNGVAIKFRGVNRHDSDPVTGYTISREQALTDLALMKRHNVNAIRTSHYPNAPWFLQLCSEMGFYVVAEADIESHGTATAYGGYNADSYADFAQDPQFKEAILDRVQRSVIRDKNNAAAIIWSMGNESGFGENFENAGRWIKKYDPSRPVHYESFLVNHQGRKPDFSMIDLYSRMYAPLSYIDDYFAGKREGEEYLKGRTLPFIQCEYIHAMGNGPGDIEDYQQQIMKYDGFCGGFVWEWCDHSVYGGQTPDNKPIYRYGGDFGEFPHDGNFCMDGLVYPDRTPHTGLLEFKNCIRPLRVTKGKKKNSYLVHNYLDFTSTQDFLELSYELMTNGETLLGGKVDLPSIPPHGQVEITLPELPAEGITTLVFTAAAKEASPYWEAGFPLGFDEIILSEAEAPLPQARSGSIAVEESARRVTLSGPDFRYEFDRTTGLFSSMVYGQRALLTRPMAWNTFRAPTDNDRTIVNEWRSVGYDRSTVKVYESDVKQGKDGVVTITCHLGIAAVSIRKFLDVSAEWTIDGRGMVKTQLSCKREACMPFLPRFGLRLFLPADFSTAEYFGYGPNESYLDKHRSSRLGVYAQTVEELFENYLKPQENGSHMGCRYVTLSDGAYALTATAAQPFSFNASRYTQEELTEKQHSYELSPCGDTVLCLDYKMSGVGSNSCGPELLPQYRLEEESFRLELALIPEK